MLLSFDKFSIYFELRITETRAIMNFVLSMASKYVTEKFVKSTVPIMLFKLFTSFQIFVFAFFGLFMSLFMSMKLSS